MAVGRRLLGSQAFAVLEHRDFRLLFLSAVASGFGDQLQTVSNLWQVYTLTGSALQLGLTGVARGVPIVLFSLVGGVLADRVDRRKVIILSQTGIGVCAPEPWGWRRSRSRPVRRWTR